MSFQKSQFLKEQEDVRIFLSLWVSRRKTELVQAAAPSTSKGCVWHKQKYSGVNLKEIRWRRNFLRLAPCGTITCSLGTRVGVSSCFKEGRANVCTALPGVRGRDYIIILLWLALPPFQASVWEGGNWSDGKSWAAVKTVKSQSQVLISHLLFMEVTREQSGMFSATRQEWNRKIEIETKNRTIA